MTMIPWSRGSPKRNTRHSPNPIPQRWRGGGAFEPPPPPLPLPGPILEISLQRLVLKVWNFLTFQVSLFPSKNVWLLPSHPTYDYHSNHESWRALEKNRFLDVSCQTSIDFGSFKLLKNGVSFVSLAMWEQKWCPRIAEISGFPTRSHSSKSVKRRRSLVEKFERKALSPCGRTLSPFGRNILQFVFSGRAFVVVLCPGKPLTGPKWKGVFSLELLHTQQWGLGLNFQIKKTQPAFLWFFMGRLYLKLRIAVVKAHQCYHCEYIMYFAGRISLTIPLSKFWSLTHKCWSFSRLGKVWTWHPGSLVS